MVSPQISGERLTFKIQSSLGRKGIYRMAMRQPCLQTNEDTTHGGTSEDTTNQDDTSSVSLVSPDLSQWK